MIIIKIKLLFIYAIIYYFKTIYSNHSYVNKAKIYLIKENKYYIKNYVKLKERPLNKNDPLILEEKKDNLKFISLAIKKNISSIKKIIVATGAQFGNILICLNKIILFCEIIGCKEIDLPKHHFWFIKNSIFLKDHNITVNLINKKDYKNKVNNISDTIYFNSIEPFFYLHKIRPEIRIHLFKEEILKNLPRSKLSKRDLYIHIRSGDIFKSCINRPYAQPPLCFYIDILNNFNFTNIYLITQNKYNPIICKLLSKFKNIIYSENPLDKDLSLLINAYNLVASISSFLNIIIILNPNLKNLYDYNIYQMKQKILQYHYDLFDFPNIFTIYRMDASKNYKNVMYRWRNTRRQRKLMIKEKCINTFTILRN